MAMVRYSRKFGFVATLKSKAFRAYRVRIPEVVTTYARVKDLAGP